MVGIVVVSHSDTLAQGVVALVREMAPPELAVEAAGGIGEAGVLGTSADLVRAAIERAMSADGVLVLMDLGSALMSAELAVELLKDAPGPVRLSDAPLVEGAVAAAVAAGAGAALEEVAAEARRALAMKAAQIGADDPPGDATSTAAGTGGGGTGGGGIVEAEVKAELLVLNEVGLHARPAARFVETVAGYDAQVRVARVGGAGTPVSARSVTNVVALGARRGDRIRVLASGPQAAEVVAALRELSAGGFGDGVRAPTAGTVLRGIGASTGIATGPVQVLSGGATAGPDRAAGDPAHELTVLEQALTSVRDSVVADRERLRERASGAEAEIFDAHLALLGDPELLEPARAAIAGGVSAERAIQSAAARIEEVYRGLSDSLLRERAADVLDVAGRLVSAMTAAETPAQLRGVVSGEPPPSPPIVLVADELLPSQSAGLEPARVAAIATARGSATAHAAIIARALGIPAVLGLGESILAVPEGTRLLVDGGTGTVTVAPAEEQVAAGKVRSERGRVQAALARERASEPAVLATGERIDVMANIGGVAGAQLAVELGAEGVGLLRTEFLYLDRPELPSEQEQVETLREIAGALQGRPLIVRTLDAGADKPLPALPLPQEDNPFLGVRGVRVGLQQPELLATQLRAILRVAAEHPLRAMLPMVATAAELEAVRALLDRARADTAITAPLELGIMVEVPSAALMAAQLAADVDFFSLGTNDLTQYTMAAARGDARLEELLSEPQPAVLQLVRATVEAARAAERWVGVCGEMAGDPACAVLLVGLGVTELSMAPALIPEVKAALRGVSLEAARAAAGLAMRAPSAQAARQFGLELL